MSATAVEDELRDFTTRLFEQTGGLVEWSPAADRGSVLAPAPIAKAFRMPGESFPLATQPTPGCLTVSLAGEFLDLAGQALEGAVPRVGTFQLGERYLKKGDIAELVARAFAWPNARVRVLDAGPAGAEYQTWHFHGSLRSEDCFEALVVVTLNARTLAPLELHNVLDEQDLGVATGPAPDLAASGAAAGRIAARRFMQAAGPFLSRMDLRLARDQRRLREYYQALIKEAAAVNRRTKTVASPEEIKAKADAVQLELRRKLGELAERYSMTATLAPLTVVCWRAPALEVKLDVTRKRSRRTHVVYWNSLLKSFEPLACAPCGRAMSCVYFTEEEVAPLCRACWEQGRQ